MIPLALSGCRGLGPSSVASDRFDYSHSISESWKRQTLLNIIKLRYFDTPIFVDVGQIVAGYSLEMALSAGLSLPENGSLGGDTFTLGGATRFIDRPTVTYTPLTGSRFIRGLMTPIPPDSVFFTIQSGWSANNVLQVAVASINGLKNQETSLDGVVPADPRFLHACRLLREIQLSGAVAIRIQQGPQAQKTILTFRSQDMPERVQAAIVELRELLGLDPDASELQLVYGATATNDRELAVVTRSVLHIMNTMAGQIDVPERDLAEGRATPGLPTGGPDDEDKRLVRVLSAESKPADAFVAVRYRNHWFWVDDTDLRTKRAFAFIMFLFTLADTGEREDLPLITIPAQ